MINAPLTLLCPNHQDGMCCSDPTPGAQLWYSGTSRERGHTGGAGAIPSGKQRLWLELPAPACSTFLQPCQGCASGSCLPPPGAAIGLHGTESPSNEQRNKSCKAGRDLLAFNILEIMRTFLLACIITGPNRITTKIYPHASRWCRVGFKLQRRLLSFPGRRSVGTGQRGTPSSPEKLRWSMGLGLPQQ